MKARGKTRGAGAATGAATRNLHLIALDGIPEALPGDNLATIILSSAGNQRFRFQDGDVLVIAQKIVSKAEGSLVRLSKIQPSVRARSIARKLKKDPRLIETVLQQSRRIVRCGPTVLITETRHGFVCANAGVDQSNVSETDLVTVLPTAPDRSARKLAAALRLRTGKRIGVIISDTFGRAWRLGQTNVAIGASGVPVLRDLRGASDRNGRRLHATILATADDIAAAAGLLMDKAQGTPVVIVRGLKFKTANQPASTIIRPANEDLFR